MIKRILKYEDLTNAHTKEQSCPTDALPSTQTTSNRGRQITSVRRRARPSAHRELAADAGTRPHHGLDDQRRGANLDPSRLVHQRHLSLGAGGQAQLDRGAADAAATLLVKHTELEHGGQGSVRSAEQTGLDTGKLLTETGGLDDIGHSDIVLFVSNRVNRSFFLTD